MIRIQSFYKQFANLNDWTEASSYSVLQRSSHVTCSLWAECCIVFFVRLKYNCPSSVTTNLYSLGSSILNPRTSLFRVSGVLFLCVKPCLRSWAVRVSVPVEETLSDAAVIGSSSSYGKDLIDVFTIVGCTTTAIPQCFNVHIGFGECNRASTESFCIC